MADLLHRWRTGELSCEIPVIVSNHRGVEKLAEFYGIPFEFVPVAKGMREGVEARQLEILESKGVDLVVLRGTCKF
jgi:formyltetrahydrofolate deformylase